MLIMVFFTASGVPKEGLSPIVRILKIDGTTIVNDEAMTEIGSGFYKYDFTTYDEDEDYVIRADGTNTLQDSERYAHATNETAGVGNILKIEKGKWIIEGNQMKIYDSDGITVLYTFDLQNKRGIPTERDVFRRIPA